MVGLVPRTIEPEPDTAAASAVATPVPHPVVPAIGKPVQEVSVPEDGVPSTGVTKVGEVERTALPVPVTVAKDSISKRHEAAVVPVAKIQVTSAEVPAGTVWERLLEPDERTVITAVDRF